MKKYYFIILMLSFTQVSNGLEIIQDCELEIKNNLEREYSKKLFQNNIDLELAYICKFEGGDESIEDIIEAYTYVMQLNDINYRKIVRITPSGTRIDIGFAIDRKNSNFINEYNIFKYLRVMSKENITVKFYHQVNFLIECFDSLSCSSNVIDNYKNIFIRLFNDNYKKFKKDYEEYQSNNSIYQAFEEYNFPEPNLIVVYFKVKKVRLWRLEFELANTNEINLKSIREVIR